MPTIAFHDNQLCERGTTISVYDYAYYNKHYLGNDSIVLYDGNDKRNVPEVIEKFKKEFKTYGYTDWNIHANQILYDEKCDFLYMQKAGEWDGKMANPHICKTLIHCVFNTFKPHGDVYARISGSFGNNQFPVVPYMVNLPDVPANMNMREELGIPLGATVFGRHGGMDQFNIKNVHMAIDKVTDEYPNIYFLFVNTERFCKEKPNVIHLDKIIDLEKKVIFINTCDAMIHAREMGETFGASVSEFSIRNKPVITCRGYDNAHLDILKEKAIIYDKNNYNSVYNTLSTFDRDAYQNKDWNAYTDYLPEKVMDIFNEIYIIPFIRQNSIRFDMEKLRRTHNCINYFETGLYDPSSPWNVSSKTALKCKFEKLFCMEIKKEWVEIGKRVFKEEIESGRYNLFHDDSANIKTYLTRGEFKQKTMFFLDAHIDNANIVNYKYRCPLLEELSGIASLERKDNVILVDDLRIIKSAFPWGETSYGNIDFLHQIKNKILSINENYKFSTLKGTVAENDVLLAYVDCE